MTDACGLAPARTGKPEHLQPSRSAVRESGKQLLRSVWDEAGPELARLVCAMGVDPNRAEDVLQDVYLRAWQKQPPGASRADLRRWLFRVTVNRCNLEHRRQGRWQRALRGLARLWTASQPGGDAADAASREEDKELVRRGLNRLEPRLRSVLVLRYFAELDSKEIGKILELPDSTVRSRLRAARRKLAWELKRQGYHDD